MALWLNEFFINLLSVDYKTLIKIGFANMNVIELRYVVKCREAAYPIVTVVLQERNFQFANRMRITYLRLENTYPTVSRHSQLRYTKIDRWKTVRFPHPPC